MQHIFIYQFLSTQYLFWIATIKKGSLTTVNYLRISLDRWKIYMNNKKDFIVQSYDIWLQYYVAQFSVAPKTFLCVKSCEHLKTLNQDIWRKNIKTDFLYALHYMYWWVLLFLLLRERMQNIINILLEKKCLPWGLDHTLHAVMLDL